MKCNKQEGSLLVHDATLDVKHNHKSCNEYSSLRISYGQLSL